MSLVDMFGGGVVPPVPPIPPGQGGGEGGGFGGEIADERLEAMKRRIKNNNDLVIILASWITNKNK